MDEKILKLLRNRADFEIGLHLLDKKEKKDIFKFFVDYGGRDIHNLNGARECTYRLAIGHVINNTFTTYESRHGFWYLTKEDYTFVMSPNTLYVASEYRNPLIYLYERKDTETPE